MDLCTPQLLLFNYVRQHPAFLLFPCFSLTSFLSTGGEKKNPEKNIVPHRMQLNPFFKCQGLEVRRGRSKFLLLC